MARHIMAVCVVCLLCADRLPCQKHPDDLLVTSQNSPSMAKGSIWSPTVDISQEYQPLNAKVFQRNDINKIQYTSIYDEKLQHDTITDKNNNKYKSHIDYNNKNNLNKNQDSHQHNRRKRHAGHSHTHDDAATIHSRPEITEDFLQRIFDEYGKGDGTIRISEFQRMLRRLGLHQLLTQKLLANTTTGTMDSNTATIGSRSCISDSTLVHHVQPHSLNHLHAKHEHQKVAARNCTNSTESGNLNSTKSLPPCSEAHVLEQQPHNSGQNYTLSETDVLNLCPVLLYQLASPTESLRAGCIDHSVLTNIEKHETIHLLADKEETLYVWMYAFISVFACGILGLVGVAIIPFMDSRYYKHIIQFLVSLAVGTMTGDALLHLLPHSLAGQSEVNMIYKGLTCMGGIIFFYVTEHGLTMISEWRKRIEKQEQNNPPSRAKIVRDPDSSINNSTAGDKLCKSKYSSYPYCYDEIAMETHNDIHLPNNKQRLHSPNRLRPTNVDGVITVSAADNTSAANKRNGKTDATGAELGDATVAQSLLATSQNNYAPIAEMNHHHNYQQQSVRNSHQRLNVQPSDSLDITTLLDRNVVIDTTGGAGGDGQVANLSNGNSNVVSAATKSEKQTDPAVTVILREHESSHHGHSHKHGHVHSPPESLSAVAWMIIMGDGLHNFTDGMAIGAAFAENIAGGFSTSLAVFCHELPHELGDFAILMKAGMSVKSAVYYNLLTGILSFIGMIFGIVFGQSQDAAQWMFAAAAGLFIYIALVDMMPEMSSSHKSLEQFLLQVAGMCSGVFLMLLIAVFEGDLMNVFAT